MFVLFPLQVREPGGRDKIPWANSLLIVINVLAFYFFNHKNDWLAVGPESRFLTIITYGFAHADAVHLLGNMWVLWLFGNPVNRRLGNGYYLLAYLGTIVALGIFARLFSNNGLIGASGAIFAVILICVMLMPMAVVRIGYVALFPVTLLFGLFLRPRHWVFWFLRWDAFEARAWIGLILIPFLELWNLWSTSWSWTHLGHLFGLLCGLAIVLLLPAQITMKRRLAEGSA